MENLKVALKRACLDRSVCQSTLKIILRKMNTTTNSSSSSSRTGTNSTLTLTIQDRIQCIMIAVRCRNMTALQTIIDDDVSVVFHHHNHSNNTDDGDSTSDDDHDHDSSDDNETLLHMVCKEYGWSSEIAFILSKIVDNNKQQHNDNSNNTNCHHEGLFQGVEPNSPLKLSLEAGSDLSQIIHYVKDKHPVYFEQKMLHRLSQIIAEYCYDYDMTVLSGLINLDLKYDTTSIPILDSVHPINGSSPLNVACYYQNEDMIRVLLEAYKKRYNDEVKEEIKIKNKNGSVNHNNNNNHTQNSLSLFVKERLVSLNKEGMSPLAHLLLNVGGPDAENAWRCITICMRFFSSENDIENENENENTTITEIENEVTQLQPPPSPPPQQQPHYEFHVLHLLLSHNWDQFIAKQINCLRILDRIVNRLEIDICAIDVNNTRKTILSIVIEKLATTTWTARNFELFQGILAYILSWRPTAVTVTVVTAAPPVPVPVLNPGRTAAMTRDGYGRLPLHTACEYSLPWNKGLDSIVQANMTALESNDPITGLPPFAHYAVGTITTTTTTTTTKSNRDINSIYELLKLCPSRICIDR